MALAQEYYSPVDEKNRLYWYCHCPMGWHCMILGEAPLNASWNEDDGSPTLTPGWDITKDVFIGGEYVYTRRCEASMTDGKIAYTENCTIYPGQELDMMEWEELHLPGAPQDA